MATPSLISCKRQPATVRLIISHVVKSFASHVHIGKIAGVHGRVTSYRGELQISVSDVVIERDPNAEILHWLECLSLARRCYGDSNNHGDAALIGVLGYYDHKL